MAKIVSINVNGKGGVPKYPVDCAQIGELRVHGDKQKDTINHGGRNRAVCLYSKELIAELQKEGHPIFVGSTGENITIEGLDWKSMKTGDRLLLGNVEIELTKPAPPCKTIAKSFSNDHFVRISEKKYPGWSRWYAKVIEKGMVKLYDRVLIL